VIPRSKVWIYSRPLDGTACSNLGGPMDVSCECRMLSRTGPCDRPVTHPEECYRVCFVIECDHVTQ